MDQGEPVIHREEVTGLLFSIVNIREDVRRIVWLLEREDGDGDEVREDDS